MNPTYNPEPAILRTGDLIFFGRITLAAAWRAQGWAGVCGWLSNTLIAFCQHCVQRSKRNRWNLIHVGMVRNEWAREPQDSPLAGMQPHLVEFTAGQKGGGMRLVQYRIEGYPNFVGDGYPGAVWHFPLRASERAKLDTEALLDFIDSVQDCTYNTLGLLAAVTRFGYKGWPRDGAYFCSEFCVKALTMGGVLPQTVTGCSPDGQREVPIDALPQQYNPCELADISALYDNSECRMIGYDGKLLRPLVAG